MYALIRAALRRKAAAATAVVLVFVIAGTVVAGSGVGGTFQLGVENVVDGAQTTLRTTLAGTATVPQVSLRVVNNATTGLSRAFFAFSQSAAGHTAVVQNTAGPGLFISVPAGKAPIDVSAGAAKAANLDSDKLDGLDSTQLQRATSVSCAGGSVVNSITPGGGASCTNQVGNADRLDGLDSPAFARGAALIRVERFMSLVGQVKVVQLPIGGAWMGLYCTTGPNNGYRVSNNLSGASTTLEIMADIGGTSPTYSTLAPGTAQAVQDLANAGDHLTLHISSSGGTAFISVMTRVVGSECLFTVAKGQTL